MTALAGCGDSSSGSSETGDSGDEESGVPTGGELEGFLCNPPDEVIGYQTECYQDGAFIRYGVSMDENLAETVEDVVGAGNGSVFRHVCCQGMASEVTADAACAIRCQELACEKARKNHIELAEPLKSVGNPCAANCGFDMAACLNNGWHIQTITLLFSSYTYWLRAECQNPTTNEVYDELNDVFDWLDDPEETPPPCEPQASTGWDLNQLAGNYAAVDDTGTDARVAWVFGSTGGSEDSQDVSVTLQHSVESCGSGEHCFVLTEFSATVPTMTVGGVSVGNAQLYVARVDELPEIDSVGAFEYSAGTIHVLMSAVVGGTTLSRTMTNASVVSGTFDPGSDALTLTGLEFDHTDSLLSATLELDVVATYTQHAPHAVIDLQVTPALCSEPVRLVAASTDRDSTQLAHTWLFFDHKVSSGDEFTGLLAPGDYTFGLIARDPEGNMDATTLTFTRSCL